MTSVSQAAAAASVLVGMLSVPAVSLQTTDNGVVQTSIPNISSSGTPKEVEMVNSEKGFYGSIETAYQDFESSITPQKSNATLESPGSSFNIKKTDSKTIWSLSTSSGTMKIEISPESVKETVETPYGTLKTVMDNGNVKESFNGNKRSKVEEVRKDLRNALDTKRQEMKEKAARFTKGAEVDVDLIANASTTSGYGNNSEEHVLLVNKGSKVKLDGWRLLNNNPNSYRFGETTLKPGEKKKVYSGNVQGSQSIQDTGLTWENGGDKAVLKNSENETVAVSSY